MYVSKALAGSIIMAYEIHVCENNVCLKMIIIACLHTTVCIIMLFLVC